VAVRSVSITTKLPALGNRSALGIPTSLLGEIE